MTAALDAEVLDLTARLGIQVARTDERVTVEFLTLAGHRSMYCEHDDLVIWFASGTDFDAFQDLTYWGTDEFGCDWVSVFPAGPRSGPYAVAVPRRDLAVVADLLRRELAGEFQDTRTQRRRRRFVKGIRAFQGVAAVALVTWIAFGDPGDSVFVLFLVAAGGWLYTDIALRTIPPRDNLDRARDSIPAEVTP